VSNLQPFTLSIIKPDGTTLVSVGTGSYSNTAFIDQTTLPTTGTYTLVLDPAGTNTGTATLNVYTVTDVTGSIPTDGTGVPVSVTTPGQNVRLTFSGTANQVVSASTPSSTFVVSNLQPFTLSIIKPDGTTLVSVGTGSYSNTAHIDQVTLPTTGTYTSVLNPAGTNTGTATLKITSP